MSHDTIFAHLLEKEFLFELTLASRLIDRRSLNEEERTVLDMLREKYRPFGNCPSTFYPHVSRPLQREYDRIHKQITRVLYQFE
jgi:hypothetical protein